MTSPAVPATSTTSTSDASTSISNFSTTVLLLNPFKIKTPIDLRTVTRFRSPASYVISGAGTGRAVAVMSICIKLLSGCIVLMGVVSDYFPCRSFLVEPEKNIQ